MKTVIATSLLVISTSLFAGTIIDTKTNSWKSVPISVDEQKHTYNVEEGYLLPEGEYYYTYSGFRCLKDKVDDAGVEPIVYNDLKSQTHAIYCYPSR